MFIIIFGTVEEIKHISDKDRLERKKYMVLWRWELELTTRMIDKQVPKPLGMWTTAIQREMAAVLDLLRAPGDEIVIHWIELLVLTCFQTC
jgi:hypothetical protein